MKKCPFCAEEIQDEAKKCRYCGEWFEPKPAVGTPGVVTSRPSQKAEPANQQPDTFIIRLQNVDGFGRTMSREEKILADTELVAKAKALSANPGWTIIKSEKWSVPPQAQTAEPPWSQKYLVPLKDQSKQHTFSVPVIAGSLKRAVEKALADHPGSVYVGKNLDSYISARGSSESSSDVTGGGKYSCPHCNSRDTDCKRHIGCAVMIIIFVSLGLGLLMIPFLPHHCTCCKCGFSWKA